MNSSEHEKLLNETTKEQGAKVGRKHRRSLRILCWILGVTLTIVLIGVTYLAFTIRSVIRNGGYSEEWTEDVDGDELKDLTYGDFPWQLMDVYVPKTLEPTKIHGAILFIHGGAWIGGDRREQEAFAKRMAKEGYLTGNMEYMLYNDKLGEYKSKYSIDMVLADVDQALAKLVEVGKEHGYEVDRVALSGHSAGGHISMLYAYSSKPRENLTNPVEIAFVAPRVGPVDFHAQTWNAQKDPKTMTWFTSFMTGTTMTQEEYVHPDEQIESAIAAISPASFVMHGVPPTLAAYGADDMLVPEKHWQLLKHQFTLIGSRGIAELELGDTTTPVFDLLIFPKSNHMLGRDPDYTLKWQGLFLKYAAKYLTTSDGTIADEPLPLGDDVSPDGAELFPDLF